MLKIYTMAITCTLVLLAFGDIVKSNNSAKSISGIASSSSF